MSQHNNPGMEIPNHPLVLQHPLPKSSLASETLSSAEQSLGEPPKLSRNRPPTLGFSFNYPSIPIDQLLIVDGQRRNGIILFKHYHAEFAGPGSAVGGVFDQDCLQALPVGNLSLLCPKSSEERQRAYLIRRQWIRLTRQITENTVALQRAQMILTQFEYYFDSEAVAELPDEAFARLVGVLPETISIARSNFGNSD